MLSTTARQPFLVSVEAAEVKLALTAAQPTLFRLPPAALYEVSELSSPVAPPPSPPSPPPPFSSSSSLMDRHFPARLQRLGPCHDWWCAVPPLEVVEETHRTCPTEAAAAAAAAGAAALASVSDDLHSSSSSNNNNSSNSSRVTSFPHSLPTVSSWSSAASADGCGVGSGEGAPPAARVLGETAFEVEPFLAQLLATQLKRLGGGVVLDYELQVSPR